MFDLHAAKRVDTSQSRIMLLTYLNQTCLVKTKKYKSLLKPYSAALKLLCGHAARHVNEMQ
jgi:hypothetical protein